MNEKTLRTLEYNKIINKLTAAASSELGKELALELVPSTSISEIRRMLKETSDAVDFIISRGNPPFGGIHDLRNILKRVEMGAVLTPAELLKVCDTLRAARNLKNYSLIKESRDDEKENIVAELINALETYRKTEDRISLSITGENEISDEASTALASIRRQIKERQNAIKDKLTEMIRSPRYQKFIQEPIVTMRNDRYVIPVKQEYRGEIKGLVHDTSSSGATLFIEPIAAVSANNEIKQLKIKEQLEIERILAELTSDVAAITPRLFSNMSILAKLDFIFAKAKLSLEYDCVCPEMNNNGKIYIRRGRHPLLDQNKVVPVDFWLGEKFRTLVITGPNTGGKTVTLKTVGLFVLMAQSGLHIPANDGTELNVFSNVFADIGDEQSIEQSLSTFSAHMTNIVKIMNEADYNSLVLFDELGAGTDPTEGAALAISILENLYRRGALTVATTHYSELKLYALTMEGVENASCEFDVETLMPTYNLLIGVPGKSNAFAISKKLGLSDDILNRAREFLSQDEIRFEDILKSIEENRKATEKEREKAEKYRLEAEKLKKELEEEKKRFEKQRDRLLREARQEARRLYLEAKKEIDEMFREMKKARMEQDLSEMNKAAEEVRMRIRNKLGEVEEAMSESMLPRNGLVEPPDNLKPGDTVLILNLNQKGNILSVPDKDGEALVQAGVMKLKVHVSNLRLMKEQEDEIQKSGIGKIGLSKSKNISNRIDIRGTNVDEAIEILDKFLDDAYLSGLHEVTIIHGKGTGALRNGVHNFLRKNEHVSSFRPGVYGEGEEGVTIVEIK